METQLVKPFNRTRLPKLREIRTRIKKEAKLLERKSIILEWRKNRKKEGEELSEKEKTLASQVAMHRGNLRNLVEEANLVQMNKTQSLFFQWIPNRGMNRKQARNFRQQRVKKARIPTNKVAQ